MAEAIEQLYATNLTPHVAALAYHYRLAGTAAADEGYVYARQAAQAAETVFAWEEAVVHWQAALSLVEPADTAARCDVLLGLGEAQMMAGEPLQVIEDTAPQAFALAEALGDASRATRACGMARVAMFVYGGVTLTSSPGFRGWAERADVALGDAWGGAGREDRQWEFHQRALALARQLNDANAEFEAVAQILGFGAGPEHEEALRQLAEEFYHRPRQGIAVRLFGTFLYYGGSVFLDWRDQTAAAAAFGELAELAARAVELGGPVVAWQYALNLTYRPLLHLGRAEDALDRLAAVPDGIQHFGARLQAPLVPGRALVLAHAGHYPEAQQELRAFVEQERRGDLRGMPTAGLAQYLEAAVLVEDREVAALLARRLEPVAFLAISWLGLTCLERHLGDAALLLGDTEEARRRYERALAIAERIGFRPEVALTRLQLGELLLTRHPAERDAAKQYLDSACNELEAMGMQPALERARRRRAEAGARAGARGGAPTAYPAGLSAREVEVLRLLAAGTSNRAIGAALVISPSTVAYHVQSILNKTGAGNRTEAAAFAHREHLFDA